MRALGVLGFMVSLTACAMEPPSVGGAIFGLEYGCGPAGCTGGEETVRAFLARDALACADERGAALEFDFPLREGTHEVVLRDGRGASLATGIVTVGSLASERPSGTAPDSLTLEVDLAEPAAADGASAARREGTVTAIHCRELDASRP